MPWGRGLHLIYDDDEILLHSLPTLLLTPFTRVASADILEHLARVMLSLETSALGAWSVATVYNALARLPGCAEKGSIHTVDDSPSRHGDGGEEGQRGVDGSVHERASSRTWGRTSLSEDVFTDLLVKLRESALFAPLHTFSAQGIANMANALVRLKKRDFELVQRLSAAALRLPADAFTVQDVSVIMNALAHFSYR